MEKRQEKEARLKAEALARQKAEEAQKRAAYLAGLASRQTTVWQKIEALITTKQPRNYDEAAGLIRDLRDVASQSNTQTAFRSRMAELRERHTHKPSLIQRLRSDSPPS